MNGTVSPPGPPRVIAFYLPQFHPTPENDAWWGSGFSEWTHVVRARPLFNGHYQPHLPTELGLYDLRVPEVRELQAAMARGYGIEAFCYYHYWFGGQRILDRVFDEVLASGRPDYPFCLCWANENWNRTWDAGTNDLLMTQRYNEEDDREHIRYLIEAFRDPRYVTIEGRPLLAIYRVQGIPDPKRTFDVWREECARAGLPSPYLCKFDTHGNFDSPASFGCDAAAHFPPHGAQSLTPIAVDGCHPGNLVYDYEHVVELFATRAVRDWPQFRTVCPGWDNSPRRRDGRSMLLFGNNPDLYERWLRSAIGNNGHATGTDNVVFVNAWNEWGEGAHLEPDERFGRGFLEATASAIAMAGGEVPARLQGCSGGPPAREPGTFADLYLDLYERYVTLQRAMTDLEAALERRIEHAVRVDSERAERALEQAAELSHWALQLREELVTEQRGRAERQQGR